MQLFVQVVCCQHMQCSKSVAKSTLLMHAMTHPPHFSAGKAEPQLLHRHSDFRDTIGRAPLRCSDRLQSKTCLALLGKCPRSDVPVGVLACGACQQPPPAAGWLQPGGSTHAACSRTPAGLHAPPPAAAHPPAAGHMTTSGLDCTTG